MKKKVMDAEHIADWLIRLGFTLGELNDIVRFYAEEDRIQIVKAISARVR